MRDIGGKAARAAVSERGQRASFKAGNYSWFSGFRIFLIRYQRIPEFLVSLEISESLPGRKVASCLQPRSAIQFFPKRD